MMKEPKILPQLLTPREAAAALRSSDQHLANLRSNGLGPVYAKMGSRVFYPADRLADYIRARIVDPSRRGVR